METGGRICGLILALAGAFPVFAGGPARLTRGTVPDALIRECLHRSLARDADEREVASAEADETAWFAAVRAAGQATERDDSDDAIAIAPLTAGGRGGARALLFLKHGGHDPVRVCLLARSRRGWRVMDGVIGPELSMRDFATGVPAPEDIRLLAKPAGLRPYLLIGFPMEFCSPCQQHLQTAAYRLDLRTNTLTPIADDWTGDFSGWTRDGWPYFETTNSYWNPDERCYESSASLTVFRDGKFLSVEPAEVDRPPLGKPSLWGCVDEGKGD